MKVTKSAECCLIAMTVALGWLRPASAQMTADSIVVGSDATRGIDTNLDGHAVPADLGQIYVGNLVQSADAITIDSGANFPPGIAFRRYLGDAAAPSAVTAGAQLGYLDFRGYSGSQFFNAASLDVVVDPLQGFVAGGLIPTKMRFAVSDGNKTYIPMELLSNGRLELGAIVGSDYHGPGLLGDPKLYANTIANDWAAVFAARPGTGAGYVLRLHNEGETANDYLLGASSGPGVGSFKFSVRGNGDVHVAGELFIGDVNIRDIIGNPPATGGAGGSSYLAVNSSSGSASATGADAIAIGASSSAVGGQAVALGPAASAAGPGGLAIGVDASAITGNATAIGQRAMASGNNSLAIGNDVRANGSSAVAIGDGSIGARTGTVAIGSKSVASATSALALGSDASAIRDQAVAVGNRALAQGVNASAFGSSAAAIHDDATAIGSNALTTAANQVALGGTGSSVRVGDIDASTDAQVGPVDVVTVDRNGTLGRQRAASAAAVDQISLSMANALAISDAQFNALQGQVNSLFDLREHDRRDFKRGIAAAIALADPSMPSGAGRTSYASNVSTYRGEIGFSAGVAHRLNTENPFALTAAVTHSGGKNTGARMGIAGEF